MTELTVLGNGLTAVVTAMLFWGMRAIGVMAENKACCQNAFPPLAYALGLIQYALSVSCEPYGMTVSIVIETGTRSVACTMCGRTPVPYTNPNWSTTSHTITI